MKKMIVAGLAGLALSGAAQAGFNPIKIITAPVTAPVKVVKKTIQGKSIKPKELVAAVSPVAAQTMEADSQLGISKGLAKIAKAPADAADAAKNAKEATAEAKDRLTEAKVTIQGANTAVANANQAAIAATQVMAKADKAITNSEKDVSAFLSTLLVPAAAALWALVCLALVGIYRLTHPKKVAHHQH